MNWGRRVVKILIGSTMLLGLASLAGAPAQAADRYSACRNRRANIERKLDRDIHRHGFRSRQAERDRYDLRRLERSCGGYRDRDRDHWRR